MRTVQFIYRRDEFKSVECYMLFTTDELIQGDGKRIPEAKFIEKVEMTLEAFKKTSLPLAKRKLRKQAEAIMLSVLVRKFFVFGTRGWFTSPNAIDILQQALKEYDRQNP